MTLPRSKGHSWASDRWRSPGPPTCESPLSDGWGETRLELVNPSLPPILARGQLDRLAARRGDAAWLDQVWSAGARLLTLSRRGQVATDGDALTLTRTAGPRRNDAWLLGGDDGEVYFAVVVEFLDGGPGRDLRELGALLSERDSALLTTAVGLANWHAVTTHCSRCGAATEVESAGWVRRCPVDGSQHFPRSDPAVIMLITSPAGDECVLGRAPSWPVGRFSCLAGFVEPGESAEHAVVREVAEESGLVVRDVRCVGSQPWPFPASLMLGFRAVADRESEPASVDGELEEVAWFSRAQILAGEIVLPPTVSIANYIIAQWLAE